jgi:hypothetical protein
MSTESLVNFESTVKRVDFFPYEWSHNLLAICLQSSVKIYSFNYKQSKIEVKHYFIYIYINYNNN